MGVQEDFETAELCFEPVLWTVYEDIGQVPKLEVLRAQKDRDVHCMWSNLLQTRGTQP